MRNSSFKRDVLTLARNSHIRPPHMRIPIHRLAKYLWASPNTILGVLIGLCVLAFGGRVRTISGVIEFSSKLLDRLLVKMPSCLRFCAITLGHVVVGVNEAELNRVRPHEHVHVRQYERWGPFFLPAYLLSSLWQLLRGRSAYRDNIFEKEAYDVEHNHRNLAHDQFKIASHTDDHTMHGRL